MAIMLNMRQRLNNRLVSWPLLSCLFILFQTGCFPSEPMGESETATASRNFLWELHKEETGAKIYLLGSLHFGRGSGYELDKVVMKAFRSSGTIVFETCFDEAFLNEMNTRILNAAKITTSGDVWKLMSDEAGSQLKEYLDSRSVPYQAVSSLKPWLISIMINALEMQRLGWDAALGVDQKLYAMAVESGKRLLYLEGIDDRLRMFQNLPDSEQETWLLETLDHANGTEEYLTGLYDSWISGELKKYKELALDVLGGQALKVI